jgi:hypothetical protein
VAESAPARAVPPGRYDAGERRRMIRRGRERGRWLFVPADELVAAGLDPYDSATLYYRVWGRRGGSVLVRVYREP